jgi:hypothetical protein
MSFFYGYHKIMTYRPYSIHQWRQADCLSITMNYYKENLNFFEPAVYWSGTKEGRTVSEFPIIYYTVAQLWKIFGYHEFIFRLVNILIVFSGLFCLFKFIFEFLSDSFWSIFVTFYLFTSPILVYYSNNFTADAPAFGIALIGCYNYWKFVSRKKNRFLYYALLAFLLAGLIKITSLIIFIALFIIFIYKAIFINDGRPFFKRVLNVLPFLIVIFIIISWYKYAILYNKNNLSGIFLQGIFPIWELDNDTIKNLWMTLYIELIPAYFNKKALIIELIIFISIFIFYKKINKFLFFLNILVFTGAILYILLWFQAFDVHDYYLTNLLIFIPVPVISILDFLKREHYSIFNNKIIKSFSVLVLIFLIYYTAVTNRMKYDTNDLLVRNNYIINQSKIEKYNWFHYEYSKRMKALETITPYLRTLGIKRTDKVFCIPDNSINISLYLMDQKGFTDYGYYELPFDQKIEFYKKLGVKYLIIIDPELEKEEYIQPYIKNKIGNYENADIFDLRK